MTASELRQYIHQLTAEGYWSSEAAAATHSNTKCQGNKDVVHDFGLASIKRSRRYEGSGERVRRVLQKAVNGEQVRIGLLGGSVSTGHGAIPGVGKHQYGAIPPEKRWHTLVAEWFEGLAGTEPVFLDGARPAVDSAFFEWCWAELIGTDVDIVFVETAINDEVTDSLRDSAETLMRAILSLPTSPAVVYVDTFSTRSASGHEGMIDGGDLHAPLAVFYDIPHISIKTPLMPHLMSNSSLRFPYFKGDERHIAEDLHVALGRLTVSYLEDQLCDLETHADDQDGTNELWPLPYIFGILPAHRITDEYDSTPNHRTPPPRCSRAGITLNATAESKSWHSVDWKSSKYYFESDSTGEPVSFNITVDVGALGQVAVSFLRSWEYDLGRAECSVAGQSKVLDGHWTRKTSLARTSIIATDVPPGLHRVECKVLEPRELDEGRHTFRVMGLMSM